jgi:predicted PurR-regulated permease PerM
VLFSEAVNLHPLVIILSVVIFGGLWGFWGVFFAIPLATLIKAVVHAWPDGLVVEDDAEKKRRRVRTPGVLRLRQAFSFSQFSTTSW